MMKEDDMKGLTEAMLLMLAQFQKGFETLRIENKDLDTEEVMALTSIWWDGMMKMIAITGKGSSEGDELWNL